MGRGWSVFSPSDCCSAIAESLPERSPHPLGACPVLRDGWVIRTEAERPWIILCHGVGSNRSNLLLVASGLHEAGLNLLLFDFRAHGTSGGLQTSFGWREQRDLEGALAYLSHQPDVAARPYGVYGSSMGGAVALLVAARDERIGAVAVESPYANLEETISRHLTLMYPVASNVLCRWLVLATYRIWFGVWPRRVSPESSVARLAPRPLLLIHGDQDVRIALASLRRLYERAGDPKARWVIQGAGHLEGLEADPRAYVERLAGFFELRTA